MQQSIIDYLELPHEVQASEVVKKLAEAAGVRKYSTMTYFSGDDLKSAKCIYCKI